MRAITISVVTNDAFGLNSPGVGLFAQAVTPAPPGAFAFPLDSDKIDAFMRWMQEQLGEGVLETTTIRGIHGGWTNEYVNSAYQKGIQRGRSELRAAGVAVPPDMAVAPIAAMFSQPMHMRRLQAIYTRAFSDLKNITEAMSVQISEVLSIGLAEGRNPREIARMINNRVDKIGLTRAKTLARTEVVRAHHLAMMEEYENFGALHVKVKGEWVIAGFNTCPYCAGMDGRIFDLETMRGLIPAHPNCRCVATPVTAFSDIEQRKIDSEARQSRNIDWWKSQADNKSLPKSKRRAADIMAGRLREVFH